MAKIAVAQERETPQHSEVKKTTYDPTPEVMHHIGNSNEFHIVGDISLPLPCILYDTDGGLSFCMSSAFEEGKKAVKGFVMVDGVVKKGIGLPKDEVDLEAVGEAEGKISYVLEEEQMVDGKATSVAFVRFNHEKYKLEGASTLTGFTSWYDFSISKNVFSMLLATLILFVIFFNVSKAYKTRKGQAPKGLQSLMEPIMVFLRDEVAKPSIGPRWERYFPFIVSLFFFILVNNLMGLIPFFPGSSNVTGNVSTTLVLAIFTFFIVNLSGNKNYWQHIFWMPGIPAAVKIILTPVEVFGVFVKPFTLFIRLFANITAGHIIILSLTSLIFVMGNLGESAGGTFAGGAIGVPFVFAMNFLELLVAFLQAFLFALLSSLYIGSAIEEHHHHEEAHH